MEEDVSGKAYTGLDYAYDVPIVFPISQAAIPRHLK